MITVGARQFCFLGLKYDEGREAVWHHCCNHDGIIVTSTHGKPMVKE